VKKTTLFSIFLAFVLSGSSAWADRYFVTFFSHQAGKQNPLQFSHTFATFTQVEEADQGSSGLAFKDITLSWGPASGQVRLLARPERGVNKSLGQSLSFAVNNRLNLAYWGPYEVSETFFRMAEKQRARLESGQVLYKVIDKKFRPHRAVNCFHAVSDIDTSRGLVRMGKQRGHGATQIVVAHLSPWFIDGHKDHPWVIERFALRRLRAVHYRP